VAKLVYLPDLAHPMAMKQSTGLWGTSEMKPVLQDGWMLTSLDATADSKTAETLQSIASLAGGAMGTAASGGGTNAAKKAAGGPPSLGLSRFYKADSGILKPGLYRFDYHPDTGALLGIIAVCYFTGAGVRPAVEPPTGAPPPPK
jgi:hypothetical protein